MPPPMAAPEAPRPPVLGPMLLRFSEALRPDAEPPPPTNLYADRLLPPTFSVATSLAALRPPPPKLFVG